MRKLLLSLTLAALLAATTAVTFTEDALADPKMKDEKWDTNTPGVYIDPSFSPEAKGLIEKAIEQWANTSSADWPAAGERNPKTGKVNPKNDAAEEVMQSGSREVFDNYEKGKVRRSFTPQEKKKLYKDPPVQAQGRGQQGQGCHSHQAGQAGQGDNRKGKHSHAWEHGQKGGDHRHHHTDPGFGSGQEMVLRKRHRQGRPDHQRRREAAQRRV